MMMRSRLALGLAAGALVIGSASPAAAGGYRGGPWRSYHHHDHGDGAAAVVGVLLGVGLIAAIASANNKKQQEPAPRYDPRYGERDYEPQDQDQQQGYDDRTPDQRSYDSGQAGYASEDEAVDACAIAARDQAAQAGGFAEVRDIGNVRPWGSGYDVTGTIDQRSSYRATDRRTRSFRCSFANGRVEGVSFGASI